MQSAAVRQDVRACAVVMQPAKLNGTIWEMVRKRHIDEIGRENLAFVVEACSRRVGKARGGQVYLSRLLGTPETHLSAVKHGKRNLRELKARIEQLLSLPDDWMDREHDESAVSYLEPRIPSRPNLQNIGTRSARTGSVAHLERKLDEALGQISELRSLLESKSNTRK